MDGLDGWLDSPAGSGKQKNAFVRMSSLSTNVNCTFISLSSSLLSSLLFFLLSLDMNLKKKSLHWPVIRSYSLLFYYRHVSTIDGERLSIRRKFLPTSWFASKKKKKKKERMSIFQSGRRKLLITCCSFWKSKTISNDDVIRKKQTNAVICLQQFGLSQFYSLQWELLIERERMLFVLVQSILQLDRSRFLTCCHTSAVARFSQCVIDCWRCGKKSTIIEWKKTAESMTKTYTYLSFTKKTFGINIVD